MAKDFTGRRKHETGDEPSPANSLVRRVASIRHTRPPVFFLLLTGAAQDSYASRPPPCVAATARKSPNRRSADRSIRLSAPLSRLLMLASPVKPRGNA